MELRVLSLRIVEWPPSMLESVEYIDSLFANNRESAVLLIRVLARCQQLLSVETFPLTNRLQRKPRTWTGTLARPTQQ
jgi:hypothetical protein